MRWMAPCALGLALFAGLAGGQAGAAVIDAPASLRGVWGRQGRCDLGAERLTITARTAGWGKGPFAAVHYDPEFGALAWVEEGLVDNFVVGRMPDTLVHNTQGFHMPGEEGYGRCGSALTRVPWPPGPPASARHPDRRSRGSPVGPNR